MRLLGVRRVQSHVRAEPAKQALGTPLQHGRTCPQDTEDGKKDS
jgi:hypothetical protein